MKKILASLLLSLFILSPAMASPEITALRQVKKAKISGVKKQIKASNKKIRRAAQDPMMSEQERNKIYEAETKELIRLHRLKEDIQEQYKEDKKAIKEFD